MVDRAAVGASDEQPHHGQKLVLVRDNSSLDAGTSDPHDLQQVDVFSAEPFLDVKELIRSNSFPTPSEFCMTPECTKHSQPPSFMPVLPPSIPNQNELPCSSAMFEDVSYAQLPMQTQTVKPNEFYMNFTPVQPGSQALCLAPERPASMPQALPDTGSVISSVDYQRNAFTPGPRCEFDLSAADDSILSVDSVSSQAAMIVGLDLRSSRKTRASLALDPPPPPRKYNRRSVEERQTDSYRERRDRNNMAVRRSRAKQKQKQGQVETRLEQLERANAEQAEQLEELRRENADYSSSNKRLEAENRRLKDELTKVRARLRMKAIGK